MPICRSAIVLLSLLLTSTVFAVDDFSPIDFCKDLSMIAKEVMTARQKDKPLSETLPAAQKRFRELVDDYGVDTDNESDVLIAEMVMGAYEMPSYGVTANQKSMIAKFENEIFAGCYKEAISDSED